MLRHEYICPNIIIIFLLSVEYCFSKIFTSFLLLQKGPFLKAGKSQFVSLPWNVISFNFFVVVRFIHCDVLSVKDTAKSASAKFSGGTRINAVFSTVVLFHPDLSSPPQLPFFFILASLLHRDLLMFILVDFNLKPQSFIHFEPNEIPHINFAWNHQRGYYH